MKEFQSFAIFQKFKGSDWMRVAIIERAPSAAKARDMYLSFYTRLQNTGPYKQTVSMRKSELAKSIRVRPLGESKELL